MSLKPPKKSDLNKGWMKKRLDREIRIQPEYHLIVTEGTDTEPQYFQAMKDIVNQQYRGKIQLDIYGEGDNTLSLFEKARNRAGENPNGYKHVWVVYDKRVCVALKFLLAFLDAENTNALLGEPFDHEGRFVIPTAQTVKHEHKQDIKSIFCGIFPKLLNGVPVIGGNLEARNAFFL